MTKTSAALKKIEAAYRLQNPTVVLSGDGGRQEKKSAQMQLNILRTAVKCLSEHGYSATTTQLVAEKADVSRGALLHHYATRAKLIASTIDFIYSTMLQRYADQISELSDTERKDVGLGMEVFWDQTQSEEYQAWTELAAAARADDELSLVFTPKAQKYDRLVATLIPEIFPEWANTDAERRQLAHDLVNVAVIGLYIQKKVVGSKRRRQNVRKFLFDAIQTLREE